MPCRAMSPALSPAYSWPSTSFDTTAERSESPLGGRSSFLLGEQLLPLEIVGELRLHLDGELVATGSVAGWMTR